MAEKEDKVVLEREYIVNLRERVMATSRYRRTPKAIKELKKFVARHMKVYDRDLRKILLDKYLNEEIWFRGIQKPVLKLKIKAKKLESGIVKVELAELPPILKFKKLREEKIKEKISKVKEARVEKEKPVEEVKQETTEEKAKEQEKKEAVVESGLKEAKLQATELKHEVKVSKQPKHQIRKALQK